MAEYGSGAAAGSGLPHDSGGDRGIAAYKQIDWHEKEALAAAFRAVTEGWVSDARWPPAPTSPGRFNVREALEALYRANDRVAGAMEELGIAGLRSRIHPIL